MAVTCNWWISTGHEFSPSMIYLNIYPLVFRSSYCIGPKVQYQLSNKYNTYLYWAPTTSKYKGCTAYWHRRTLRTAHHACLSLIFDIVSLICMMWRLPWQWHWHIFDLLLHDSMFKSRCFNNHSRFYQIFWWQFLSNVFTQGIPL